MKLFSRLMQAAPPSILATAFLATQAANAAKVPDGLKYTIEPIVGFEHVQQLVPTPHSVNRIIYGARATAGYRIISAEAELTRGTNTESFPVQDLTIQNNDDKLKIGLRSGYSFMSYATFSLRAGGQATRAERKETTGSTVTVVRPSINYAPYAGTELRFAFSNTISFTTGIVVVFKDTKDMSKNDYQTTAGFQIRYP
jgi:hypothetical protein